MAFHKVAFEAEGDRGNRQRLRQWAGFTFDEDSEEYQDKIEYMGTISIGDLVSICNLLGIDHEGNKEQMRQNIVKSLMDINSLLPNEDDDEISEDSSDGDLVNKSNTSKPRNTTNTDELGNEINNGGQRNETNTREERNEANGTVQRNNVDNREENDGLEHRNRGRQVEFDDRFHLREEIGFDQNSNRSSMKFALSYKDVEDFIRPFSGEDDYPIERWVLDFEEAAILFDWDDLRMLIFAKKSLKGLAKTFVQGEKVVRSWLQLKNSLSKEFSSKMNSADLHKLLTERKMKKNEGVREYSIAMKELASRGLIEDDALIDYIIRGIEDEPANKVMLYGTTIYSEFKERLKAYEKMKKMVPETTKSQKGQRDDYSKKTVKQGEVKSAPKKSDRCYNCGEVGHRSRECSKKSLGSKCFKCEGFGHIAKDCNSNSSKMEVKRDCNLVSCVANKCEKDVFINNVKIVALVDSGSDLTLLREEQYKKIGSPMLSKRQVQFRGAGSGRFETLGDTNVNLIIDHEIYPIIVHIVPDGVVQNGLILGTDFLRSVELNIKKGVVTITKLENSDIDLFEVLKIDVIESDKLDLSHIKDESIKNEVTELIMNYSPQKIKETGVEMRIVLMDDIPVYERPRRLADIEEKDVEKQVRKWYDAGIIKLSISDYCSRVVPVPRKNGPVRVCVDYRKVNTKTVKVRFPAPIIEEQLDKLQGAKIYTTMDMENGFLHVRIEEGSRKYTAFSVPSGHYEFTRAPFGFCNSPAYFFRYIHAVFRELIKEGIVVVYIDDFVIPSDNVKEGVEKLRLVLKVASEYGLKFNWHKCQFLKKKINYLGHVVENGKVSPSEDKTNAVKHFPKPNNVKAVQSFLGLTGYFRKFIPQYAFIARPLSDLLRKEQEFQFGKLQEDAFNQLKKALSEQPILHLFKSTAETELHTDASSLGFGAILLQRSDDDNLMHPVYYASGKTSPAESRYDSYKLEVLAVIRALKKFRTYLLGIDFVIVTDCKAFTQTLKKKDLSVQVTKWALFLEEFRYRKQHAARGRVE